MTNKKSAEAGGNEFLRNFGAAPGLYGVSTGKTVLEFSPLKAEFLITIKK
jgi:hypothetical protein